LNYADDLGHCTEVQQLSSAVDIIIHCLYSLASTNMTQKESTSDRQE